MGWNNQASEWTGAVRKFSDSCFIHHSRFSVMCDYFLHLMFEKRSVVFTHQSQKGSVETQLQYHTKKTLPIRFSYIQCFTGDLE